LFFEIRIGTLSKIKTCKEMSCILPDFYWLFCTFISIVILIEIQNTCYTPPAPPLVEDQYHIIGEVILSYMEQRREARRRG
jgi:hypothetical protein